MSELRPITRILIANRGEIAVRIIKTCRKAGIYTVGVYSESDKNALHVKLADEAHYLGPSQATHSYLQIDKLLQVAEKARVEAVHPGYGFLSENPSFALACETRGLLFLGPSSHAIRSMGSKIEAKKRLSGREGIPLIPGTIEAISDVEEVKATAREIGFPVLLKASAGGGGKGMRIVRGEEELESAVEEAQSEALSSFGDSSLLLEKYFEGGKHIEVQIIGDLHGNVMHLFERECSVQRRHQKVIEEAPSGSLSPDLRQRILAAAIAIGQVIGYVSVGTVEFILHPPSHSFYFLEVNTRLQVEHPVTELITRYDLVLLQIDIARGRSLFDLLIPSASISGHAIEVRLYAEDANNEFFPSTGKVLEWKEAEHPNIRYDTGIEKGSEVSVYYDPLLSKIIAYGEDREQARTLLIKGLQDTVILGLTTNKPFLLDLLSHPSFIDLSFTTHMIDHHFPSSLRSQRYLRQLRENEREVMAVATLWSWNEKRKSTKAWRGVPTAYRNNRYANQLRLFSFRDQPPVEVSYLPITLPRLPHPHSFRMAIGGGDEFEVQLLGFEGDHRVECAIDNVRKRYHVAQADDLLFIHTPSADFSIIKHSLWKTSAANEGESEREICAEMPARILQINVKNGDLVKKGDVILVIESMKMQSRKTAPVDGTVKLYVKESDLVDAGALLVAIE